MKNNSKKKIYSSKINKFGSIRFSKKKNKLKSKKIKKSQLQFAGAGTVELENIPNIENEKNIANIENEKNLLESSKNDKTYNQFMYTREISPSDLIQGKQYYITNLGYTGDYMTVLEPKNTYIATISSIIPASNLVNKDGKKIYNESSPSLRYCKMPFEIKLTNIFQIVNDTSKDFDNQRFKHYIKYIKPSYYMIQWWNISADYKKPIFYEPTINIKKITKKFLEEKTNNNLRNRINSYLI